MNSLDRNITKALMIFGIKYIPVLSALFMLLHCIILVTGHDNYTACCDEPWLVLPYITLLLMSLCLYMCSEVFYFCKFHRMLLIYTICVSCCIVWRRCIGFGPVLEFARYVMIVFGFGLIGYWITHLKKFHNCRCVH